jgi:hypothetical protein
MTATDTQPPDRNQATNAVSPPRPDFDEMCAAIAAAGQDAMNPDAGNRQALFERAILDVLDLRAHAMEIYVRHARNPDVRRKAYQTRKRAERRIGRLLISAEQAASGTWAGPKKAPRWARLRRCSH